MNNKHVAMGVLIFRTATTGYSVLISKRSGRGEDAPA